MELNIGDKIRYQEVNGDSFKGQIIDISTNDDQEITGYFAVTDSGLYIHFHSSSLTWVCVEEPVTTP